MKSRTPQLRGIAKGLLIPSTGASSSAFGKDAVPITIHLAGDSTLAEKLPETRPETGWGECLGDFFDQDRVRIQNHAKNGRSTKSFIDEGLWAGLVQQLKAGDYVFIQFGHNDQVKEKVGRYTPPEDYRNNLIRFVGDVRRRKAFPVLLTSVARRNFDGNGILLDSHGEYPEIARSVAAAHKVPLIDLQPKSEAVLDNYGAEASKSLFLWLDPGEHPNYPAGVQDNTHFSPRGAQIMAARAVDGIREAKLPLAHRLKALAP
jgi:lysophospholipase L1-like esterase